MEIKDYLPKEISISREILETRSPDSAGYRQMLVDQDDMTFNIVIHPDNTVKLVFVYSSSLRSVSGFFRNVDSVRARFVSDESGGGTVFLKKLEDGD